MRPVLIAFSFHFAQVGV